MKYNNIVYSAYLELNNKFKRKQIVTFIEKELNVCKDKVLYFLLLNRSFKGLQEEHLTLKRVHTELSDKNITLEQEHMALNLNYDNLSQQHQDLSHKHNEVTTKYDLVSNILSAKNINNVAMQNFNALVENDFLEFANQENSLANEAKAILMLQSIQRELQMISSFPSVYNKNIVAVGGGFSAGKSEFISSFFANKSIKLPIGIKPVTAIPTYISNGNGHVIKGYSYQGGSVDISSKLYAELSHDFIKSFSFNLKDIVPMIAIETEIKNYNNICFIDTPGYNPTNTGTTDSDYQTATEYLENVNVLLWVIGLDASDGAIPASDLDFLEGLSLEDKKLFVIGNKADLKSPDDLEDVLDSFEEMLDEYDIDYYGISAYNSIGQKEISFRKESLINFLQEIDNPISAKKQVMLELDKIFNMYRNAINEQLKWTKGIQSDLKSLELDFMQDGMDIYESERANERLEKIREMFKTSRLNSQLKTLKHLKTKMTSSVDDIFKPL
jgi:GTPase Era involved in 16S rRNA processing